MTPRLVLALVRRGGVALLAAVALGWWTFHIDNVTRQERAETEKSYRSERAADRKEWSDAFVRVADACLGRVAAARAHP